MPSADYIARKIREISDARVDKILITDHRRPGATEAFPITLEHASAALRRGSASVAEIKTFDDGDCIAFLTWK